jgi:GTP-binding protein
VGDGFLEMVVPAPPVFCEGDDKVFTMNISSVTFDRSAPDLAGCPDASLPEFTFIGRSNVGKSSLLNMLAGQAGLARVSPRPGFTKLINFFTVDRRWRLVDLPGYGFAQGAHAERSAFNEATADYLAQRQNLCVIFLLIDSGLPPQAIDLEFVQWLADRTLPFVLVFTKVDQRSAAEVQTNITTFKTAISGWFTQLPQTITCSSTTRQGRQELLAVVAGILADGAAPETPAPATPLPPRETEPAFGLRIRAGAPPEKFGHKQKRTKTPRPW